MHATSICDAVGAAVAVAMPHGQDEAGIASAAGIAASTGAGLLEANGTGGTVKRSTTAGPRAAAWQRLTWLGTGSPARRPCWRAASGSCRRSAATAPTRTPSPAAWARTGSCRPWSSSRTPCNHFTHAGVEAALRLGAQGLAPPTSPRSSWTPHARPAHDRQPPEAKARPASGYRTAFSGPTRSPRRCSAAASACPTRTSPTPPPMTPATSPWPSWCVASSTSAAARVVPARLPGSCA